MPKPTTKNLRPYKRMPIVTNLDAKPGDENHPGVEMMFIKGKRVYISGLPYEWWVDHHGNVVPLATSTNRNPDDPEGGFDQAYSKMTQDERRAEGWKPLHEVSDEQFDELVKAGKVRALEAMGPWLRLTPEGQAQMNEDQQKKWAEAVAEGLKGNVDVLKQFMAELLAGQQASAGSKSPRPRAE